MDFETVGKPRCQTSSQVGRGMWVASPVVDGSELATQSIVNVEVVAVDLDAVGVGGLVPGDLDRSSRGRGFDLYKAGWLGW